MFRWKVEAIRARIDLEEAPVLPRVANDPVDIDLIAGALEQQAPRRMSQDIEMTVIHGAEDAGAYTWTQRNT